MHRPTRTGLIVAVLLLVSLGAYTAYWLIAADRIKDGVAAWAQSARAQRLDVSWQSVRVSGYPFAFRIELETAALRDNAMTPAPELRVPALSGSARPWNFRDWQLNARQGLSAALAGAGERPSVKFAAQAADGAVSVAGDGGATIWLSLRDADAEAGESVAVGSADGWLILPAKPPQAHTDPDFAVAADLRQIKLPLALPPFGNTVDDLAFGATVKGVIPAGPLRQAASAWRDAGGTIEINNLRLATGNFAAEGSGTLALDQDLQPAGSFSSAIEGYEQIPTALVGSGRMKASDAGLARLGLSLMAKSGPDGRPQITTSFTIQNGQMFLGPAKLGRLPRIAWE